MSKKILLIISIFFISYTTTFGAGDNLDPLSNGDSAKAWAESHFGKGKYIKVTVQEPIPGMNCTIAASAFKDGGDLEKCTPPEGKAAGSVEKITDLICPASMSYDCYQEKGFGSLKSILGTFIGYLTILVGIVGVLFLVINGIMLSMTGVNSGAKENVKKGIFKILLGLLVLFLGGFLLTQFAPWIYK